MFVINEDNMLCIELEIPLESLPGTLDASCIYTDQINHIQTSFLRSECR